MSTLKAISSRNARFLEDRNPETRSASTTVLATRPASFAQRSRAARSNETRQAPVLSSSHRSLLPRKDAHELLRGVVCSEHRPTRSVGDSPVGTSTLLEHALQPVFPRNVHRINQSLFFHGFCWSVAYKSQVEREQRVNRCATCLLLATGGWAASKSRACVEEALLITVASQLFSVP